jgi:hypothetical protein
MKWNKYYGYIIAISILMLLLAAIVDPPIAGRPYLIGMILINGVFAIFCKGWQRFLAIGFVILGIFMLCREASYSELLNKRLERIKEAADNYAKTNTPVLNSSTNSTK